MASLQTLNVILGPTWHFTFILEILNPLAILLTSLLATLLKNSFPAKVKERRKISLEEKAFTKIYKSIRFKFKVQPQFAFSIREKVLGRLNK